MASSMSPGTGFIHIKRVNNPFSAHKKASLLDEAFLHFLAVYSEQLDEPQEVAQASLQQAPSSPQHPPQLFSQLHPTKAIANSPTTNRLANFFITVTSVIRLYFSTS